MKTRYLYCYVFVAVIFAISILNLVFRPTVKYADDAPKPVLTIESLKSGDYFKAFENYFQNKFMFRLGLVEIYNDLSDLKGITTSDTMQIVKINGDNLAEQAVKDASQNQPQGNAAGGTAPPKNNYDIVDEDWGKLLIYKNTGVGINVYDREACVNLADTINQYQQKFSSLHFYVLISPTHAEMMAQDEDIPTYSQKETINLVYQNLNEAITKVDAYGKLIGHRNEYIFFNTDHHWTQKGAYYAYTAFMEAKGEPYPDINQFSVSKIDSFLGSYYTMTLNNELKNNPDYLDVYTPSGNTAATFYDEQGKIQESGGGVINPSFISSPDSYKYNIFLGGDHPLVKITTSADNNRKILIIKDSFANAFTPFLTGNYKEIYLLDPRLFKGDMTALIKTGGITDVLFLNNALRMNNETYVDVLKSYLALQK